MDRTGTAALIALAILLSAPSVEAQEDWVPALFFATSGAALVVGTLAGIATLDKAADLDGRCPQNCTVEELDNARIIADASTAGFAVGGIAAVAGTATLLLSIYASDEEDATRLSLNVPF